MADLKKTMGHVFYTTSSFVHHLKANGEFKLELQSRNTQFGSRWIFLAVWPWNLMEDLNNNEARLQYHVKLCASFKSQWWIQTGVTVQKHPVWVKIDLF